MRRKSVAIAMLLPPVTLALSRGKIGQQGHRCARERHLVLAASFMRAAGMRRRRACSSISGQVAPIASPVRQAVRITNLRQRAAHPGAARSSTMRAGNSHRGLT
jgi:hypothetical protein